MILNDTIVKHPTFCLSRVSLAGVTGEDEPYYCMLPYGHPGTNHYSHLIDRDTKTEVSLIWVSHEN